MTNFDFKAIQTRIDQELREAPASPSVDVSDLAEVRVIGRIQLGDLVYIDGWLIPVVSVQHSPTGKMVEFRAYASDVDAPRTFFSGFKHRSSTTTLKAIGTQVFRKIGA